MLTHMVCRIINILIGITFFAGLIFGSVFTCLTENTGTSIFLGLIADGACQTSFRIIVEQALLGKKAQWAFAASLLIICCESTWKDKKNEEQNLEKTIERKIRNHSRYRITLTWNAIFAPIRSCLNKILVLATYAFRA